MTNSYIFAFWSLYVIFRVTILEKQESTLQNDLYSRTSRVFAAQHVGQKKFNSLPNLKITTLDAKSCDVQKSNMQDKFNIQNKMFLLISEAPIVKTYICRS